MTRGPELERLRGHREFCVVGQQSDDSVEIALRERVDESINDLCFTPRGRHPHAVGTFGTGGSARARWRALLTDAGVDSSISATSEAEKPSTSWRTSAARCWSGSRCRLATKESAMDSRAS